MIIRKITITNFRQFKDRQVIEFSTDRERNVSVILGQNTSGKTTLIQAFNWCLYENTKFKTKEIISKDIISEMPSGSKAEASVEVELVHDNRQYSIWRMQRFEKLLDGNVRPEAPRFKVTFREKNGETQEISQIDCKAVVESILPEQLSDYFFFAGEHINEINKKGNVRDAVRGLMGLEVISNGMDRFDPKKQGSVISELRRSLDTTADASSAKLQSDLVEAQKRLSDFEKRKKELEEQSELLKAEIQKKSDIILANQGTKLKQEERARLEKDLQILENRLVDDEKQIIEKFMIGHFKYFAKPLYIKALKVIEEARSEGAGVPHMHAKSIEHLLTRGRCLCGTDLTRNQGAVDALEREKALLPPASIGTLVYTYRKQCESFDRDSDNYAAAIESSYKSIRLTKNMIDEKKQRLAEISRDISTKDINVAKIESDRRDMVASLERCEMTLRSNAARIGETENEIKNIEKKIDGLVASNEKNAKTKQCLAYAYEIFEWFKRDYDINVTRVKNDLSKNISELFSEMFHGKRIVEIDENYRITLKVDNGRGGIVLDPSMGEEAVKNFAFISGLVALARERAQKKDEVLGDGAQLATEPYPLVMDAPFSNTDEVHIANISRVVPRISEQVIFIIMKKDWDVAKKAMEDRVGKVLEIEKLSATHSVIRGGSN